MPVVHFERALRSRKGLYQIVNRETARAIAGQGFTWLNREEDLGDGLIIGRVGGAALEIGGELKLAVSELGSARDGGLEELV